MAHSPQPSQCCLNTSDTTLSGTNYLCNVGRKRTVIFSEEDNLCYNVALQEILQGPTFYKKLPMYEPQSTNNSAQENNLQFCLGLSRPTLHEEITGAMLAHMLTMFMRKVTYIMLYRPFCGNIIILFSQCCPNTSETTLHKKITYTILIQRAQTCFRWKTGCSFKCLVACFLTGYNITEKYWVF